MICALLQGRLGNQLFIYAMAKAVQLKRGKNEKIVMSTKSIEKMGVCNSLTKLNIEDIEFSGKYSELMNSIQKCALKIYSRFILSEDKENTYKRENEVKDILCKVGIMACENGYMNLNIPETKNLFLIGYFQSEMYFAGLGINRSFFPKESEIVKGIIDQMNKGTAVSIHIRRGDYLAVSNNKHCVCTSSYYKKAIETMEEMLKEGCTHYFVFSDDIEFVKKSGLLKENTTYIPPELDDVSNIYLMSHCKHYILSNSSFGWWGQYLNKSINKVIIAPDRWYNDNTPEDIISDEWVLIGS